MKNLHVYNGNIGIISLRLLEDNNSDFDLIKEILLDKELMETSTIFNRSIARDNSEIEKIFQIFNSLNRLNKNIGFYKLFDPSNNFIGVAGFVLLSNNYTDILEFGFFIKKEYQSKHLGSDVCKFLFEHSKKFSEIKNVITTSFEDNIKSNKILTSVGIGPIKFFYKENNKILISSLNDYKIEFVEGQVLSKNVNF